MDARCVNLIAAEDAIPETKRPERKGGNPRGPNGKCQLRCAMEESAAQTARRHGDFGAMHANRSTEEANVEGTFCYRIVTALLQHDAEGDSKQPPAPDLVNCTVLADQQPTEEENLDYLAETQGFEPWIQVLARMLP